MIELQHLEKRYGPQLAVDDLNLVFPEGQVTALLGPSGCGKTTTLRMINRLIEPTGGRVLIGGQDTRNLRPEELRRRIGYVIQQIGLFPHLNVAQNVATVPDLLGQDRNATARRVDELLELVGLDPELYRAKKPSELSGGQAQRVGVARALAADPPLLLMDEPFGALDPLAREHLQNAFRAIQRQLHKTVVMVTHDIDEALRLGDRIALMNARRPDHAACHPVRAGVSGRGRHAAATGRANRRRVHDPLHRLLVAHAPCRHGRADRPERPAARRHRCPDTAPGRPACGRADLVRPARRGPRSMTPGRLLWPVLLLVSLIPGVLPALIGLLNVGEVPATFDPPLWKLTLLHLALVLGATTLVVLVGLPLAVAVTRPGRDALRQLAETLAGLGQTVPTFAILALAVPALGFGWKPTLLGLFVYGLMPVLSSSIAAFRGVDRAVLDAARSMGMTTRQQLMRVELPLARPLILAGLRTSVVYNVGTATVGAALGAGGLGEPIINGLSQQNTALVLVGAVLAALLALSLDALLGHLEKAV